MKCYVSAYHDDFKGTRPEGTHTKRCVVQTRLTPQRIAMGREK